MKIQIGILISVSVAVFSSTALSAAFLQGDVFVGGNAGAVGTIYHYNNSGTLVETLLTGSGAEQTGMAFNSDGSILHATNFGPSTITRFSSATGAIIAPNPWLTNDSGSHNESLVFDIAGNFYVGQPDGTRDILKRAPDGSLLGRFDVATTGRGTDWIDLSADQKTLFYSGEGRIISRYNVATSMQLADFATLPGSGNAFALRLLGDGGLLVADASNIKRLDGAGNVIQIYDTPGEDFFFALNLDPNGTDFWTAGYSTGNVYKFNVSSGLLKTTIDTPGGNGVSGLVVKGELTQGNPSVPEPSTVIFGVALSFVCGALRSRRSR